VATDGPGLSDEVEVTINVTGNNPPVAADDHVITNADFDAILIPEWALLRNDYDPDGDSLDVTNVSVNPPVVLHFEGVGDQGSVQFFLLGFIDSFTYSATDGVADSAAATVNIEQVAVGEQPPHTLPGSNSDDIIVAHLPFQAILLGYGGDDILLGGDVDDMLEGGRDNDILVGGTGVDRFGYSFNGSGKSQDGFDEIVDFKFGEDKLEFKGLGSDFTLDQFKMMFEVTEVNVGGDELVSDMRLSLQGDDSWSVDLLDVGQHSIDDFHASGIFS